jgi:signal transduction histidine kinase/ActR/RegA family two-component response regulator
LGGSDGGPSDVAPAVCFGTLPSAMGVVTNKREWAGAATNVAVSRVASHTRWLFTGGVPLMLLTVALQKMKGQPIGPSVVMALFHCLCTGGLWVVRDQHRWEGLIGLIGLLGVQTLTLIIFGPTSAVGMLTALMVVVSLVHFQLRGALITLAATTTATVGIGVVLTLLDVPDVPALDLHRNIVWTRTAGMTLFLSLLVLFTIDRILRAMRQALDEAKAANAAEAEARRLQAVTAKELARTRELESVGRLAGGVAHDFNNALTVILSCASELAEDPDSQLRYELAHDIEQAARGAAATTRQLLALAKMRRDATEVANPAECLRTSLGNLKRLISTDLIFDAELEDCSEVPLGEGELIQIVVNLVLNARDACTTGDRILVRTRQTGDEVLISVADTGRGIDESTMKRVFEPFFTTKEQDGTGLGLAMVKATVSERGGRVDIESRESKGTEVRIFLPALKSRPSDPAPLTNGERLDGMTVLLVEDEMEIQRSMQRSLEQAGARVRSAQTAAAALTLLRDGAQYDLLCTDGILLGGTALPVIQAFLQRFPSAPILLCSGHVPAELEIRGLLSERHVRLPKPFTPAELVQAISRLRAPAPCLSKPTALTSKPAPPASKPGTPAPKH